MTEHRCFCPQIGPGRLELPPEEAHHAATVMRVRAGEAVTLFDGQGRTARATVREVRRRAVCVETDRPIEFAPPPAPSLVLHVAMPKTARQHLLIEKCTELGVNGVEPILTEYGVAKPTDAGYEKWRRFAVEAAKQSRQLWLPELRPAKAFIASLGAGGNAELSLIASPQPGAQPIIRVLLSEREPGRPIHVWIGPEGGFSPHELSAAEAAGLVAVSLGPTILRVETAAIAAAALVRLIGD